MNSPHYDTKIKYERVETLQELNFVQFVAVRKFLPHECWRKNSSCGQKYLVCVSWRKARYWLYKNYGCSQIIFSCLYYQCIVSRMMQHDVLVWVASRSLTTLPSLLSGRCRRRALSSSWQSRILPPCHVCIGGDEGNVTVNRQILLKTFASGWKEDDGGRKMLSFIFCRLHY